MAGVSYKQEDIAQLLHEADCSDEFTQQFLTAMGTESVLNQLHLLHTQRSRQLERVHIEEKKLDRLDFLRYVLEKQMPAPPGKSKRAERGLLL